MTTTNEEDKKDHSSDAATVADASMSATSTEAAAQVAGDANAAEPTTVVGNACQLCRRYGRCLEICGYSTVIGVILIWVMITVGPLKPNYISIPPPEDEFVPPPDAWGEAWTYEAPVLEREYIPGLLVNRENGLELSSGLTARILATSGIPVAYDASGEVSNDPFHVLPDGAACFSDPDTENNPGGWIYASNSEAKIQGYGGVGAITFDADGRVLNYQMVLQGTTMNCGGGKTPWDTWVSCEEWGDNETSWGQIYQVDPSGQRDPELVTLGKEGGKWESFAYDIRDTQTPYFFVTEDVEDGALQRFLPQEVDWDSPWDMLHGDGTTEYLLLSPDDIQRVNGTFEWGTNKTEAQANAIAYYPNTEGIAVYQETLFFVCKKIKMIYELNLDTYTYTRKSTRQGLFDGEPDQLKWLLSNEGADEYLIFTEEGGTKAGVHGRDENGNYFTLLESSRYSDETTGLAFNPDFTHLYVAYQQAGLLFDVSRLDGLPLHAKSFDVKYHATT